jgi:hypothetical protein
VAQTTILLLSPHLPHTPDHPRLLHLRTHDRPPSSSVHLRLFELTMAEMEYDDPKRIELLTALKKAVNCNIPSTFWACLWLSDINRLEGWVDEAQRHPDLTLNTFWNNDSIQGTVQKCKFTPSHNINMLILYRDSTPSCIIYSETNIYSTTITFTTNNSTTNIPINFSATTSYSTECVESSWS